MEMKLTELEQRMMAKLKTGPVLATNLRSWEKASMVRLTKKSGSNGIPLVIEQSSRRIRSWVLNNGSFVLRDGEWRKVEPKKVRLTQDYIDLDVGIAYKAGTILVRSTMSSQYMLEGTKLGEECIAGFFLISDICEPVD